MFFNVPEVPIFMKLLTAHKLSVQHLIYVLKRKKIDNCRAS
ncbi:hypothetical protein DSUL_30023 [Desulfovibrionales bacterium]